MEENLYSIIVEDRKLAEHMSLSDACLFIEAYMERYFAESGLSIELRRENGTL